jgi:hypothetical protein
MQLKLQQTKNYNQFKKLSQNRKVNTRQVLNLENSIKELDLTMFNPIMVKNNYIIDGQHRFDACRNLGKDIWYIELDHLKEQDIPRAITLLNSNAKNWSAEDYLNLYCHLGVQDYIKVKDYMKDFEMNSLSVAIYFLSGFSKYKSAINKQFKNGEFEICTGDLIRAEEIGQTYKAIKRTVETLYPLKKDSKFVSSNAFLFAFAQITERVNFNHKNLISNLSVLTSNGQYALSTTDSTSNYYAQLAQVHNYGLELENDLKVPETMEEDDQQMILNTQDLPF